MSQHHALIKNDKRWKQARADCFERDGQACVECGATEQLQADHIVRLSEAQHLAYDVDNLQTLCHPCHIEKEREYEANRLVRNAWLNPKYSELSDLVGTEKEIETLPVF